MPLKCFIKPNRREPRRWTAEAAARAVCAAVNAGESQSEIRLLMRPCVECEEPRRKKKEQAVAQQALEQSQQVFAVADAAVAAFEIISRIVGRVARFVPQARPAGLLLLAIERQLGVVRNEIRVQRAANDAVIALLRRAA